ncbi:MAG: TIGR03936 family radical SAM-associated protein [Clostridia bacterium]|nr:TIGR03936 family radical SAM-associated protein [Clostridia bacterium]
MTQDTPLALRCRFEKKGPIRFISHLDLTRAFHRAFARAGLPLKFSEGFSPHPRFSLALPLSVGTESLTEIADFTLKEGFVMSEEEIKDSLQAQFPKGIEIVKVEKQEEKFSSVAYASYKIHLPKADPSLLFSLNKILEGEITVQKKNKKGKWVEKDVKSGIRSISLFEEDGGIGMEGVFSVSADNYLKPEMVLEGLRQKEEKLDISEKYILRCALFREDMTKF